jgi:hypothetical protein
MFMHENRTVKLNKLFFKRRRGKKERVIIKGVNKSIRGHYMHV